MGKRRRNVYYFNSYHGVVKRQLEAGLIEKVTDPKLFSEGNKTLHLPHQEVLKECKITLVRAYFDCSSKHSKTPQLE